MKFLFSILFFLTVKTLPAQSIGLRMGHSLVPADHVSLRYEHWTNSEVNLTAALSYENSRANSLRYGCIALNVLGEYVTNRQEITENLFGCRLGLGATVQNANDPWLFNHKSFAQRLNYGLLGECALECYLTDNFRLSFFAQQKYLLRTSMGSTRLAFGIGLTYNLSGF